MMDTLWRILAIALLAAVIVTLLKKTSPDMAYLLTLAVCGIACFLLVEFADQVMEKMQSLFAVMDLSVEIFLPLFKMIAIAVLTKIGADICRDAGESAFGNLIETAGACTAIILSLPIFSAAWELLQELL